MNLRFYVRPQDEDGIHRSVVFLREVVPRRAIAAVAWLAYNEPYATLPMSHAIFPDGRTIFLPVEDRRTLERHRRDRRHTPGRAPGAGERGRVHHRALPMVHETTRRLDGHVCRRAPLLERQNGARCEAPCRRCRSLGGRSRVTARPAAHACLSGWRLRSLGPTGPPASLTHPPGLPKLLREDPRR